MKWPWQEFADDPIGYCRSFLIVVAMFMVSALIIGLVRTRWALPTNLFQVVMTLLVIALAVLAVGVAVLSSDASVERVADAFSRHEVSILLLALAWPLHVVLGRLWKRKRNG
jgi:biotin transporter BioY